MKNTVKVCRDWKGSTNFMIGFTSWIYFLFFIVISEIFTMHMEAQLWALGILEATWLACAGGFLLGCASWWEQRKTLQKPSLLTRAGCFLSGGFFLAPLFSFLYAMFIHR
jgi:hypothetical protein